MPNNPLLDKADKSDPETLERFKQWSDLVGKAPSLSEKEKLEHVNRFFNKMKWMEDKELWGQRDYWATPAESLLKNAGDCEDFSIAKYFTLLEMGVAEEKLSISYVKFKDDDQAHMVLSYYPGQGAAPLILDNARKAILKSSVRDDIVPVFHMGQQGVWREGRPAEILGTIDEIDAWKKMSTRMTRERSE